MSQQKPYVQHLFLSIFGLIVVSGCSYSRADQSLSLIYRTSHGEIHCGSTPGSTEVKLDSAILDKITRTSETPRAGVRQSEDRNVSTVVVEEYKAAGTSFDKALESCKKFLSTEN